MDDNEKYVRSKWEVVVTSGQGVSIWPNSGDAEDLCANFHSWSTARAFTEARLKEIAEVKEEIAWLAEEKRRLYPATEIQTAKEMYAVPKRILSREQSVLAALRMGLKEEKL